MPCHMRAHAHQIVLSSQQTSSDNLRRLCFNPRQESPGIYIALLSLKWLLYLSLTSPEH